MHSVGNSFDRLLTWVVRLAYMVGMSLGIYGFFIRGGVDVPLVVSQGFALSMTAAVICHGLLQQRRVMFVWSHLNDERDETKRTQIFRSLMVNVALMSSLLVFGGFAVWVYLYRASHGGLAPVDDSVLYTMEALVLPVFELAASFIIEVVDTAHGLLKRASAEMLFEATKMASKQWRSDLRTAVKEGRDLSPIMVELQLDSGDGDSARRTSIIKRGLTATAGQTSTKKGLLYDAQKRIGRAFDGLPLQGGAGASKMGVRLTPASTQLGDETDPQNEAPGGSKRKSRATVKVTPRERAKRYMKKYPDKGIAEVARQLNISENTVRNARDEMLEENVSGEQV